MKLGVPLEKSAGSLATALAEKGTPGILLLAFIFLIVWIVPLTFTIGIFYYMRELFPLADSTYGLFCAVLLSILIFFSFIITRHIIASIIPTIRAEAETMKLMPHGFGGRVSTITGDIDVSPLPAKVAKRRIHQIMECLVECAAEELALSDKTKVRSNIFITNDNQWLHIANDFHVNMQGATPNVRELSIKILNGYFFTGAAYKYFRPILSVAEKRRGKYNWSRPDRDTIIEQGIDKSILDKAFKELNKANKELSWIVAQPIPYQTSPFEMACGVLNLDGLGSTPFRDQLMCVLADTATAAALIGIINRTRDIMGGQCQRPAEIQKNVKVSGFDKQTLSTNFLIDLDKFDPVECPEPSERFKNALSTIKGLEFMKKISTTDVAMYVREQLRLNY